MNVPSIFQSDWTTSNASYAPQKVWRANRVRMPSYSNFGVMYELSKRAAADGKDNY